MLTLSSCAWDTFEEGGHHYGKHCQNTKKCDDAMTFSPFQGDADSRDEAGSSDVDHLLGLIIPFALHLFDADIVEAHSPLSA